MPENQENNKAYSADQIAAIERSLSPNRLNHYLLEAKGDKNLAIRLYERNTELSEALYGVIQGLEVTLRNAIHRSLQKGLNVEDWYDQIQLEEPETEALVQAKKAVADAKKPVTAPRVIAKINFGFWVRLTASTYEKRLWVPHLHKVFPVRMVRSLLYKRLHNIKDLRNKIAHHERISSRDTNREYEEILETIRWICPITYEWVKSTNRFEKIRLRPRS